MRINNYGLRRSKLSFPEESDARNKKCNQFQL